MSHRVRRQWKPTFGRLAAAVLLLAAGALRADDVATSTAPAGTLLRSTADGWKVVEPKAGLAAGDTLLALPLSQASLTSKGGGVRLEFLGNLPQLSPFPILESAVTLRTAEKGDLDVAPLRGRVVLVNAREKGPAHVRVRLPFGAWDVTLVEPDTQIALEVFGRWPRGVPFSADKDAVDEPTRDVVLLVLKGSAELTAGGTTHGLTAPPGPAYFHWDSVGGNDPGPQRTSELPEWRTKDFASTAEGKAALEAVQDAARRFASGARPADLFKARMADAENVRDPLKAGLMRRGSVYGMAALDVLDGVVAALGSKHADVREVAVQALRHWIGRERGQDLKLYEYLQSGRKLSKNEAATILDLLHSPSDADLRRPETYETYIAYLSHPLVEVRELAAWHLYRLVPQGKEIAYDAAGNAEGWDKATKEWKKLVPPGKLPPEKK